MTFLTRVDRQFMLRNWISRNLKPIKRFNMYYGDSRILLRLAKENDERLADIDHEEFKQAMARCGFYADTSYTDEHCTKEPSWEPLARRSGRTGAVEVEKRQEQE